jgi:hypothetical protein
LLKVYASQAFKLFAPVLLWLAIGRFIGLSVDEILLGFIAVAVTGIALSHQVFGSKPMTTPDPTPIKAASPPQASVSSHDTSSHIGRQVYLVKQECFSYAPLGNSRICQRGEIVSTCYDKFDSFDAAKAFYELVELHRSSRRRHQQMVNSVYVVDDHLVDVFKRANYRGTLVLTTPDAVLRAFAEDDANGIRESRG